MALFLKSFSTGDSQPAGQPLPIEQAKEYIKNYNEQATDKKFGFQEGSGVNAAIAFDSDSLNRVLSQPGCKGLRLYFGIEPSAQGLDELTIIVVAIDDKKNDIGFTNGQPSEDFKAEETGTKSKTVLPQPLPDTNRAYLLEQALK